MDEKLKEIAEQAVKSVEGIERTGLRILDLKERYFKTLMPLQGNINHIGIMYAGSLFTLGEFSGGIIHMVTFDYKKLFPIVKEISIRFRRPAATDVTLEYEMPVEEVKRINEEAMEKGKADFTLDLELKDESGEVVSIVQGVWQVRKIPDNAESFLA